MNHFREVQNRRKGLTISIVFHAAILLLGITPFIVEIEVEPDFSRAIAIDFSDNASKASGSASSPSAVKANSQIEEWASARRSLAKVVPIKAIKQVPRIRPSETSPDIITSPEPDIYVPPPRQTYFDEPLEVAEHEEIDAVEAMDATLEEVTEVDVFDEWSVTETESNTDELQPLDEPGSSEQGNGSESDEWFAGDLDIGEFEMHGAGDQPGWDGGDWPGEGNSGKAAGNGGKDAGIGNEGAGKYWGDLAGDGLFNRKVIKRANVGRLAEMNGKIVVNLCVDKEGKVTVAEFDAAKSTIHQERLTAMAEDCARHYLFEQDHTAPVEQCGRLTFIFKIER